MEELREALQQLLTRIQHKVAPDILAKVDSITTSILDILPRIAAADSSDHNLHVIRQTALEYLPEALEHYLNLPKAFAHLHPVKHGKTARQLLLEQLELLDVQMRQIAEDLHRNDTERLLIHGRFLEEKFRRSEDWLGDGRSA